MPYLHHRRSGVFGRIGQCFGHDVVGADFDGVGQPSINTKVEVDRDGRAAAQCLERRDRVPPWTGSRDEFHGISLADLLRRLLTQTLSPTSCSLSDGCSTGTRRLCQPAVCSPSATSRCWAPSCRSRSRRRRASSPAATMRTREAIQFSAGGSVRDRGRDNIPRQSRRCAPRCPAATAQVPTSPRWPRPTRARRR